MMDIIKNIPSISREEYLWQWTLPQIQLAMNDMTQTIYLSDKQAEKTNKKKDVKHYDNPQDLVNDLGLPIFG